MRHHGHSCNYKSFLIFIFFTLLALSPMCVISTFAQSSDAPDAEESHPGIGRESRYAEAVIAYNKKQTDESIKILDSLLKEDPHSIEYLELKALALKGKGDDKASLTVYWQLYKEKPEKERGPYAYEIATILEKQKKSADAKPYFLKSAELGFNVAASYLYVGLGEFNASHYAEAEVYFTKVTKSDIPELELVGRYYVSLCYFKMNFGTRGIQELVDARDVARSILKTDDKNTTAKSINDASAKMLEPFSRGNWFGNATLITQYDSNVQQLPAGSSITTSSNNPASIKENAMASIGYMSASNATIQYIAGYRASYNYNFNPNTKTFEYFTNNATLFLTYRPLAKTSWGVKLESNFAFQNISAPDSTPAAPTYIYNKYNFTAGVGPYFRYQLDRYWKAEINTSYRTQKFYLDDTQSGVDTSVSISAKRAAGDKYINPGVSLLVEHNGANGGDSYYNAYGLGLSNSILFPGQVTFGQNFDFLFTNYSRTAPHRTDCNYGIRFTGTKQFSPKFSVIGDVGYTDNLSSVPDAYTYHRFATSLGVSYSL